MPGAFLTEDLPALFEGNDFGEGAGIVTWKGTAINDVIWDDGDVEVTGPDGATQIVQQAMMTCKSSDFSGIALGDAVVRASVNFTVKNWKDDGTGVIEIFLERV